MMEELELFERVEKLSPEVFARVKGDVKVISANVDFYSGLIYQMLGIPSDLYTPMFAVSRMAGWCAHLSLIHIWPLLRKYLCPNL